MLPNLKQSATSLPIAFCHAPCHQLLRDLQSEYGDLYKITLAYEGDVVTELRIKYFDTIPPCTSICVLKTGFLFAASEFGNHALYQFLVSLALDVSLMCMSSHHCLRESAHPA